MRKTLKKLFLRIHQDDRGAMSVEKVLILAVIALPILIVLYLFRQTIVGWFNDNARQLNNTPTTN
jgi:Flp pilus assembly pilin Flp